MDLARVIADGTHELRPAGFDGTEKAARISHVPFP
jgi:hypothetical protein